MLPPAAAAIGDHVSASQFPAVGILLDKATHQPWNCAAVLIGCRSVLSNCGSRYWIGRSQILFPNAGLFDIVDVKLHPGLADIYASGVAVLVLDRPVTGITPARVSTPIDPADYAAGTPGTVVSYNAFHAGIKHALKVPTWPCPSSSNHSRICWERQRSAAGSFRFAYDGVLFLDLGAGPVVAGLQAGGSHAVDLFRMRDFVQYAVAQDDDAECLAQPVLGGDAVAHFSFIDFLTAKAPSIERRFDVPEGASELRVVMSATPGDAWQQHPGPGPDLFLARGSSAGADSYDCAIEDSLGYGACVIPAPAPGTWTARTERTDLPGAHQVTVTVLGAAPGLCGDGVRDALEECDGDDTAGCPAACLVTCRCDRCGDHILDFGEQCDDGTTAGDGCDACTIEPPELSVGGRFRGSVSPIRPDRFKLTLTAPSRIRLRLSDHGSYTNAIGSVSRQGVPLFEFEFQTGNDDTGTPVAQGYGLAAGTYDLLIYEDPPGADDRYTLDVTVTPATCGDGHVEDGAEECEDGNTVAGDGCSAECLVEAIEINAGGSFAGGNADTAFDRYTFRAVDGEQLFLRTYDAGGHCPTPAAVQLWLLEDGRRWPVAGDSYDSPPSCVVLPDLRLVEGDYELRILGAYDYYDDDRRELEPYTLTVRRSVCADGVIGAGEECDDGDRSGGDGCDAACSVEPCNSCTGQPSACAAAADAAPCSDGVHCNGGDACSAGACVAGGQSPCTQAAPCALECDEALDTCACVDEPAPWVGCGDGELRSGEECDDGNRIAGDGCDWSCDVERCQQCQGEPSVCEPVADDTPCPDSSFCNGVDTCQAGKCTQHSGDPCADDGECGDWCDEAYDDCAQPFGTLCSGAAGDCMHDVCDGAGTCMARPDRQACPLTLACGGSFVIGAPAFGARRGDDFHDFILTDAAEVRISLTLDSGPCPTIWGPHASLYAVQPDGTERYVSYAPYIDPGAACATAGHFAVAGHYRIMVGSYDSTVPAYTLSVEATCPQALGCGADVELPDGPVFLALDPAEARVSIASADASGACPSDSWSVVELDEIRHDGNRILDVDGGYGRCARLEQELRRGHYSVDTRRYRGASLVTRLRVEDCATCGDGQVGRGETCDDAGTAGGDGCSPTCTIEPCHVCTGEPSSCAAVEADGAPCDDGVFCNGPDQCLAGACTAHAGDPCAGGGQCANLCQERERTCSVAARAPCADDGDACTRDECDGSGTCAHPIDARLCVAAMECGSTLVAHSPGVEDGEYDAFTFEVTGDTAAIFPRYHGTGWDEPQLELYRVRPDGREEFLGAAYATAGEGYDPSEPVFPDTWKMAPPGTYRLYVFGEYGDGAAPYTIEIGSLCALEMGCGEAFEQSLPALQEDDRHHVMLHWDAEDASLFARTRVGESGCGDNDTYFVLYHLDVDGAWTPIDDEQSRFDDDGVSACSLIDHLDLDSGYYLLETHNLLYGSGRPEPYELELGLTCRICGDGVITGSEECDDGNTAAGDGCGSTCAIDPCFTCANEPSICTAQPDGTACQDDFFCNGSDACIGAACSAHAGNPCPGAGACSFACNEESQTCQTPLGKSCQSDADPCTHDACDAAGSCEHLADTSVCRADVECAVAMILTPAPLLDAGRVEFTIDELRSVQIDTYDVAGTCAGPGTQLELFQVLEDQSVELLRSAVADDPLQCPRIQTHLDGGDYAVEVTALYGAAAPPVRILAACAACGDGLPQAGENCDDGNTIAADGCSTCEVDSCYACAGQPSLCVPAEAVPCDDGIFCNGADACAAGQCSGHGGDPCAGGGQCSSTCDESSRSCFAPRGTACGDDADPCTVDRCDGNGICRHFAGLGECAAPLTCAQGLQGVFGGLASGAEQSIDFQLHANVATVTIATSDGAGGCPPSADTTLELYAIGADDVASLQADDDDSGEGACSQITKTLLAGHYRIRVRGKASAAVAAYVVELATGLCIGCGDGNLAAGEGCDDGNAVSGDGCELICQQQPCWICQGSPSQCEPGSAQACDDATFCNGVDTCIAGACASHAGDPCTDGECIDRTCDEGAGTCQSSNWPAGSDCDDADACTAADSCDGQGACRGRLLPECGATCGDASLDFGEECDDGNSASDDGCTTMCAVCGNGVLAAAEQCDDGVVAYTPGDACAMDCTLVPCGRPVTRAGSMPMAKDALFVLRAAVGAGWCASRVCDTDSSGVIDVIDGLRVLLRAVGGAVEFDCPVGLAVTTTTLVPVSTTSSPVTPDIP